jgi:rhamnogalacturonyl hydrolase YesR
MEAYKATNDALYHDLALRWAQAKNWQFRRPRHADYQCIGQVYLELHLLNSAPHRIKATQTTFDNILSDPRPGDIAWHWADALFMAPPVLSRLAEATGDTTYLDFMSQQFWEASAPLYDSSHHLYYRDERYVDRETEHGKDVFWARGNGWVLAGLARILQFLPPDHPSHGKFVNRFRDMATVVTQLQSNDGFWRTSLLDPTEYPAPESSGTGLFCYALAWGINEGYLNAERYQPVVLKAWHALTEATNDEGRVGWVQEPGSRPGPVSPDDTGAYGAGAFLMAGSEVIDMMENKQ